MTKVFTNGQQMESELFQTFNWDVFNIGRVVYLDGCEETDYLEAAYASEKIVNGERQIFLTASEDPQNSKSWYGQ